MIWRKDWQHQDVLGLIEKNIDWLMIKRKMVFVRVNWEKKNEKEMRMREQSSNQWILSITFSFKETVLENQIQLEDIDWFA